MVVEIKPSVNKNFDFMCEYFYKLKNVFGNS